MTKDTESGNMVSTSAGTHLDVDPSDTPTRTKETGGATSNPTGTIKDKADTFEGILEAPASGITSADNKEAPPEETDDPRSSLKERNNRYILSALTAMATGFFVSATLGWGPMQLMLEGNGNGGDSDTTLITIGIMVNILQITCPFLGMFVDKFGPKLSWYVQATLAVVGLSIILIATFTVKDALLYVGFSLLACQTWMGSIMIVQLGLYFEGHTISRVIYLLNYIFDAGVLTYLALWGVQLAVGATTSGMVGGYLGLAVLIYSIASYYWTIAVPECSSQSDDLCFMSGDENNVASHDHAAGVAHQSSAAMTRVSALTDQSRRRSTLLYSRLSYANQQTLEGQLDQGELPRRLSHRRQSRLSSATHFTGPKPDGGRISSYSSSTHFKGTKDILNSSLNSSEMLRMHFGDDGHEEKHTNNDIAGNEVGKTRTDAADGEGGDNKDNVIADTGYVIVADRATTMAQLTATPFLLLCAFFGIQNAMSAWNLATQQSFLKDLGDDNNLYLTIFTLLGPAAIVGAPFMDWVVLHLGWNVAFQMINGLSVAYMVIKVAFSKNLQVQIVGFVIYSFYRSFFYGISFSYLPLLLGGPVVGRGAGLMGGCAGVANALLLPLVSTMNSSNSDDESVNRFLLPNIIVLCLNIPVIVVIAFLGRYMRLEGEAKEAKMNAVAAAAFAAADDAAALAGISQLDNSKNTAAITEEEEGCCS